MSLASPAPFAVTSSALSALSNAATSGGGDLTTLQDAFAAALFAASTGLQSAQQDALQELEKTSCSDPEDWSTILGNAAVAFAGAGIDGYDAQRLADLVESGTQTVIGLLVNNTASATIAFPSGSTVPSYDDVGETIAFTNSVPPQQAGVFVTIADSVISRCEGAAALEISYGEDLWFFLNFGWYDPYSGSNTCGITPNISLVNAEAWYSNTFDTDDAILTESSNVLSEQPAAPGTVSVGINSETGSFLFMVVIVTANPD